jgi:hypothetical protein
MVIFAARGGDSVAEKSSAKSLLLMRWLVVFAPLLPRPGAIWRQRAGVEALPNPAAPSSRRSCAKGAAATFPQSIAKKTRLPRKPMAAGRKAA